MAFNWNHCVSLIEKPKGARKQAADARLERYKKQMTAAMPGLKHDQLTPRAVSSVTDLRSQLEGMLGVREGTGSTKPMSSTSQRRARQKAEVINAATSLMSSSVMSQSAGLVTQPSAGAPGWDAQAQKVAALEQQVATLSQQVRSVTASGARASPAALVAACQPSLAEMTLKRELQALQLQQQRLQRLQRQLTQPNCPLLLSAALLL